MITLCQLSAPVHITQPESPHLKPFTFFVGSVPQADGSHRLCLNMGYFATLAEAEEWVQHVRGRYPHATATLAPAEFLRAPAAAAPQPAAAKAPSLTDTQVMDVLETRGVDPLRNDAERQETAATPLLRPEDTSTRRVLKEAVVQGAPISFALQLHWSAEPIDLRPLQSLPMFKDHLLYVMESRRGDRTRYFLRLGFFADPVSAREVAPLVRARFSSPVVVPVTQPELQRAREPRAEIPAVVPRRSEPAGRSKPDASADRAGRSTAETLDRTLELLAEKEMWADPDSTSESGVRHLKVVVQRKPGRPRSPTDSSS